MMTLSTAIFNFRKPIYENAVTEHVFIKQVLSVQFNV